MALMERGKEGGRVLDIVVSMRLTIENQVTLASR